MCNACYYEETGIGPVYDDHVGCEQDSLRDWHNHTDVQGNLVPCFELACKGAVHAQ